MCGAGAFAVPARTVKLVRVRVPTLESCVLHGVYAAMQHGVHLHVPRREHPERICSKDRHAHWVRGRKLWNLTKSRSEHIHG